MAYIVVALLGMAGGAFCVFMILEAQRKKLREQKEEHQTSSESLKVASQAYSAKKAVFEKELAQFKAAEAALASSVVPYRELQEENAIVKRDLHNLEVHGRKLKLDQELQRKTQETLDLKVNDLGSRYLKENVKWLSSSLNSHNFANCKQRLQDVIDRCRGIGFDVPAPYESSLHTEMRSEYQKVVRAAFEREEQARIKAQIREEQIRQREIDRELAQLEREREAIAVALEKALADTRGQHSEEVERLKARLTEAEEKIKAGSVEGPTDASRTCLCHFEHWLVRRRCLQGWVDAKGGSALPSQRAWERFGPVSIRRPYDDLVRRCPHLRVRAPSQTV